jgi:DNA polymerase-1
VAPRDSARPMAHVLLMRTASGPRPCPLNVLKTQVAKELDEKWLAAWPEQRDLQRRAKALTYGGSFADVLIPGANILRGSCGYTQILNTPFQGLGAVGCKLAMWRVSREMYCDRRSPLWGSRLVLQVHDELISELLADRYRKIKGPLAG